MRNSKLIIFTIFSSFIILFSSCIDDDGNLTTPPVLCNDVDYFGFRADGMSNGSNTIEVVRNNNSNFNLTSFTSQTSFTYNGTIANNSATFDKNIQKMAFIDEWNIVEQLFVYDFGTNAVSVFPIAGSNRVTAPIFLNGTLYVLEKDSNTSDVSFKTLSLTGTLSTAVFTIPAATIGFLNPDTMNNLAYSTTDGGDFLYFLLGGKLLTVDVTNPAAYTLKTMPNSHYLDIAYMQTGELLTVKNSGVSVDLMRLDISAATITETVEVAGLDINPESVAIVYKECGDRAHVLTHFVFGGANVVSKIHEVNVLTHTVISNDFSGWMFGFVHKEQ